METNHISLFPDEHFFDIRPYQYGWEECKPSRYMAPSSEKKAVPGAVSAK